MLSMLFFIFAISIHLAAGIFLILLYLIYIFINKKIKFYFYVKLFILTILIIIFSEFYSDILALFDYRTKFAFITDSGESKPLLHFYYFVILFLFLHKFRYKIDKDCKSILYGIITFAFVCLLISFFMYNLLLSRVLHGLSILSIFFFFRGFLSYGIPPLIFISLLFPISIYMTLSGFYFENSNLYLILLIFLFFAYLPYKFSFSLKSS
ncbi:hypothetical protein CBI30_03880 [Polynucleobacter aenigmaticus]|uniref:Uncharacterized protein n=2 Tax=Polynucleobacter aenigmaticus TaxID=1743164 RepID=A0A254Q8Z4_9BURK|nr:hypothetical protein CBI30_03880 [Polynucleobacter aenigmaticus]